MPGGNGHRRSGLVRAGRGPVSASSRGDVGFARGAHADSAGSQWFVVADAENTFDTVVRREVPEDAELLVEQGAGERLAATLVSARP